MISLQLVVKRGHCAHCGEVETEQRKLYYLELVSNKPAELKLANSEYDVACCCDCWLRIGKRVIERSWHQY